jgi:hypothetical protein
MYIDNILKISITFDSEVRNVQGIYDGWVEKSSYNRLDRHSEMQELRERSRINGVWKLDDRFYNDKTLPYV